MLAVLKDRHDEIASTRMWMTKELPDDIDDWPDGWVEQLWSRFDALLDSEELEAEEARTLAEHLVRERFRTIPDALELL